MFLITIKMSPKKIKSMNFLNIFLKIICVLKECEIIDSENLTSFSIKLNLLLMINKFIFKFIKLV